MSKKTGLPDLSKAEYDILRVLWKQGRQTIRELHDRLYETSGWAYTTTKTMMDRMVQKGLLSREQFHGIFLYQAIISRPAGLAKMVKFFADRVVELDSSEVVAMFAQSKAITAEEIKELEALLLEESRERENG
ncbi:BlaI/MecI/CopY family transcriptional regulator [candidate division KSB1 bacterium]|nr:BlaI/MecI/CopY family transcriptional regulator [candidate division KSB1 bacterium]